MTILVREIHTDERYWGEDAKKFNPDRFLPERIKSVHPSAYVPFSQGPRICIAHSYALNTLKTFLSLFLRKYRVSTSLKFDELVVQTIFTIHIKQGFMVKVEKR